MSTAAVLGIVGSPREDGNTTFLTRLVLEQLQASQQTALVYLKDYDLHPCRECYACVEAGTCAITDGMQALYAKVHAARALVIASPVFMGGVTALTRTFMERTWHLRKGQLAGKLGSFVVVGRRDLGVAIPAMEAYLSRLQVTRLPGVFGFGIKVGEVAGDAEALARARKLGQRLRQALE